MPTPFTTKVDYTQEVRFAIVMYGGISLAIYINGVAQELLRLVRSTAKDPLGDRALLNESREGSSTSQVKDSSELSGTERVYRKLGQMLVRGAPPLDPAEVNVNSKIRTRFIVDILSGSSAGGINAVFLAKALTNDQPLNDLENLWVDEGEMAVLINDRESLTNTELRLQDPPKSLLNSQRMYWQLLDALEGMEKAKPSSESGSTNVEELDLFVTATDIEGQIIKLQLADRMVEERRHRKVFHFVYDSQKDPVTLKPRNDFDLDNNPFLAFAARATSAHPAAFEPMTLGGINDVLERHENYRERYNVRSDYAGWQKFYREYLQGSEPKAEGESAEADKVHKKLVGEFASRAFNDGGVLDNQPFSHTIDALPKHQSDYPTVRKLLYIEPAPENPKADPDDHTPDFVENAWLSLSTLPRYEPIREHLQRVLDRNRLSERVGRITRGMEQDIRLSDIPVLTSEEFERSDLKTMVQWRGFGWGSYQRLRVGEVTDELALLVARTLGFDEDSDEFRAVWYIVRYWRNERYSPNPEELDQTKEGQPTTKFIETKNKFTETKFLMDFDVLWRLRRLRFVMSKIDDLACFDENGDQTLRATLGQDERDIAYPMNGSDDTSRDAMREVLLKVKGAFNSSYKDLRLKRQQLWSPVGVLKTDPGEDPSPIQAQIDAVRAAIIDLGIESNKLPALLERLTEAERIEALKRIVGSKGIELGVLESRLSGLMEDWFLINRKACESALNRDARDLPGDVKPINKAIQFYFDYFDYYDMVAHPILYATDAGDELVSIEVFRISPEDACRRINEKDTKKRKLAGTKLGNFGAFFKREFRTNDILWGRLDGAERIITALLPDKIDQEKREALIDEAHNEIIKERLGIKDDSQLLEILNNVDKERIPGVAESVNDPRVQFALGTFLNGRSPAEHFEKEFLANYDAARQFNSQDMVKNAARASKVFGRMLEGYAKLHQFENKRVVWVTRLAQIFWGLVQVAIPGSIPNLVFQHWLKLLYLFEFLLILLGTLLTNPTAQQFGWLTFGLTVAVHTAQLILSDTLKGKYRILNFVGVMFVLVVLLLTGLGVISLLGVVFGFDALWHGLSSVQAWQAKPAALGWNTMTLVKAALLALVGSFLWRAIWKEVAELTRTRLVGLLSLLLGIAVSAALIHAYYVTSQSGRSLPGGLHLPALAIEMVQQPADVLEIEKVIPAGELKKGVSADFGFIALYTVVFLSFSYWMARRRFRHSVNLGIIAAGSAIATAGFDVLENFRLYTILDSALPDAGMIKNLYVAAVLKWSFCFITVGLLSFLFLLRKDRLKTAGFGLLIISIAGLLGLFLFHPALEISFGLLGVLLTLIGLFITVWPERFLTIWR